MKGAIAFSSSTDVNYNPGGATAVGFSVGFLISYSQSRLKRKLNKLGVVDSNSAVFHFLVPSLFAALISGIEQGSGKSAASYTAIRFNSNISAFNTTSLNYPAYVSPGRP